MVCLVISLLGKQNHTKNHSSVFRIISSALVGPCALEYVPAEQLVQELEADTPVITERTNKKKSLMNRTIK